MSEKVKEVKELRLNKETLRNLSELPMRDLDGVAGGGTVLEDGKTDWCSQTACYSACRDTDFCCELA